MDIYGYLWVCMGIYGYVWVCVGIYRYIGIVRWSLMYLNDYPLGLVHGILTPQLVIVCKQRKITFNPDLRGTSITVESKHVVLKLLYFLNSCTKMSQLRPNNIGHVSAYMNIMFRNKIFTLCVFYFYGMDNQIES